MPDKPNPPTDYRKMRRATDKSLLILVIVTLVVLGTTLIGAIWGLPAAITGGLCLGGGAALIGGLWLLMGLIERWVGE